MFLLQCGKPILPHECAPKIETCGILPGTRGYINTRNDLRQEMEATNLSDWVDAACCERAGVDALSPASPQSHSRSVSADRSVPLPSGRTPCCRTLQPHEPHNYFVDSIK